MNSRHTPNINRAARGTASRNSRPVFRNNARHRSDFDSSYQNAFDTADRRRFVYAGRGSHTNATTVEETDDEVYDGEDGNDNGGAEVMVRPLQQFEDKDFTIMNEQYLILWVRSRYAGVSAENMRLLIEYYVDKRNQQIGFKNYHGIL
jgi:hypothetical protein